MILSEYLLDTNTIIYLRRGVSSVTAQYSKLNAEQASMSVVSYGELVFGAEKSSDREKSLGMVQELANQIPVLPLGPDVANEYARIRTYLERRGDVIGSNDLWIAAHAKALGFTLVTDNVREFHRVRGLTVTNWMKR